MYGVGRLDAEGCERAWANLNQAAGSTCEKGHGARIEALNHCMQDWNWKKTTGIGKYDFLCVLELVNNRIYSQSAVAKICRGGEAVSGTPSDVGILPSFH